MTRRRQLPTNLREDRQSIVATISGLVASRGTKTDIRAAAGIRTPRFNIALASLLKDG